MTFAIFHDFQGLENGLPKFHDFPWPGGTLTSGLVAYNHEAVRSQVASAWGVLAAVHSLRGNIGYEPC